MRVGGAGKGSGGKDAHACHGVGAEAGDAGGTAGEAHSGGEGASGGRRAARGERRAQQWTSRARAQGGGEYNDHHGCAPTASTSIQLSCTPSPKRGDKNCAHMGGGLRSRNSSRRCTRRLEPNGPVVNCSW